MRERPRTIVRRRDLLGLALAGAGAAVATAVAAKPAAGQPIDTKYKRRSRYQPFKRRRNWVRLEAMNSSIRAQLFAEVRIFTIVW